MNEGSEIQTLEETLALLEGLISGESIAGEHAYLTRREVHALRIATALIHDELENASMMDDEGVAR